MNNNCNIIKDLLPLYAEDLLSDESRELVENHLKCCEECKVELARIKSSLTVPTPCDKSEKIKAFMLAMKKYKKLIATIIYGWIIFGIMVITGFDVLDLFLNFAWMFPLGAVGYILFQKSAFYRIPIAISISYFGYAFLGNMVKIYEQPLSTVAEILICILLFSLSSILGILAMAFVNSILKNISKKTVIKRVISVIVAFVFIFTSVYLFFAFIGNPFIGISSLAKSIEYIDERFEGKDYYPYKIRNDCIFEGSYIVYVKSISDKDINFQIKYNSKGNFQSCDYDKKYKSDAQTILSLKYARLIDNALNKSDFSYEIIANGSFYTFPYNNSKSDVWDIALTMEDFDPNEDYDLSKLGKTNGLIIIELYSTSTSDEEAKKVYLELKRVLDKCGIGFRKLAINLISTQNNSKVSFSSICYENIIEEQIDSEIKRINQYQEIN